VPGIDKKEIIGRFSHGLQCSETCGPCSHDEDVDSFFDGSARLYNEDFGACICLVQRPVYCAIYCNLHATQGAGIGCFTVRERTVLIIRLDHTFTTLQIEARRVGFVLRRKPLLPFDTAYSTLGRST
jgi:hypothetical protein